MQRTSSSESLIPVRVNRRRFLRLTLGTAGGGALMSLLAACSSPAPASPAASSGSTQAPTAPKAAEPTKAPAAEATAKPASQPTAATSQATATSSGKQPKYGGTLTIVQPISPMTLDPIIDPGAEGIYILEQVMEGLMRINEDQSIGPGLAEKWEISKDQKTWTFDLRKGVKFHNGDSFTADDVIYTFARLMDPKGVATFKALYNDQIAGLEKVDDFKVIIHMKEPWPAFPVYASTNHTKIVNKRSVEEAGDKFGFTTVVGTGFMKFQSWEKDNQVALTKFDGYWQKGLPYLDKAVYRLIADPQVAKLALTSGQVDVLQDPPVDQIPELSKNPDVKILKHGGGANMIVDLNSDVPPFNDKRVRQAVSMAINRNEIAEVVFYGTAEPANDFFPSWFWADNPDFKLPYDPGKAKQLLADAGYGPGKPLQFSLMVYNTPPYTDMGQLMQAQLAKIGVNMEVRALDKNTVIDYSRGRAGKSRNEMQAAMTRHIARANHWEFSGNRYASNGKLNFLNYNKGKKSIADEKAEELFKQVGPLADYDEKDREKGKAIYKELAQLVLVDDVPQLILVHQNNVDIVRKNVENYPSGAYDWAPIWKTWIDK